jgi:hypothetical protein
MAGLLPAHLAVEADDEAVEAGAGGEEEDGGDGGGVPSDN